MLYIHILLQSGTCSIHWEDWNITYTP